MPDDIGRRRFLEMFGVAAAGALAGCGEDDGTTETAVLLSPEDTERGKDEGVTPTDRQSGDGAGSGSQSMHVRQLQIAGTLSPGEYYRESIQFENEFTAWYRLNTDSDRVEALLLPEADTGTFYDGKLPSSAELYSDAQTEVEKEATIGQGTYDVIVDHSDGGQYAAGEESAHVEFDFRAEARS